MSLDRRQMEAALPGYDIGAELGRGAFGLVFDGTHRALGRRVAIKQLPRALAADPDVRARFLSEARIVASLAHPHIVPVYDYVERDGLCLLVFEHLGGGTLGARLRSGPLDAGSVAAIGLALAGALDHAHGRGVLHRDIKPDNILFAADGTPKLSDFGIAKILEAESGLTAAGSVVGTPAYMAPEQALGAKLSPATDLYSTGVVLYEALTGRLPFPPTDSATGQLLQHAHDAPLAIEQVAPSVPPAIAAVVMRCLAKDPADRWPTAAAFAADLAAAATADLGPGWLASAGFPLTPPSAVAAQPVAATPAPPPPVSVPTLAPRGLTPAVELPTRRRRRGPVVAAAVVLGAVLTGVGVLVATAGGGESPSGDVAVGATSTVSTTVVSTTATTEVPTTSSPGTTAASATTAAPVTTQATSSTDAEGAFEAVILTEWNAECTERGYDAATCTCIFEGMEILFPSPATLAEQLRALAAGTVQGPRVRNLLADCGVEA